VIQPPPYRDADGVAGGVPGSNNSPGHPHNALGQKLVPARGNRWSQQTAKDSLGLSYSLVAADQDLMPLQKRLSVVCRASKHDSLLHHVRPEWLSLRPGTMSLVPRHLCMQPHALPPHQTSSDTSSTSSYTMAPWGAPATASPAPHHPPSAVISLPTSSLSQSPACSGPGEPHGPSAHSIPNLPAHRHSSRMQPTRLSCSTETRPHQHPLISK